jgi:hypothetical protein
VIGRRNLRGSVAEVAGRRRLPYRARIIKIQDGQKKTHESLYDAEPIHLAGRTGKLWLVVVTGFRVEPLMLPTHTPVVARNSESVWWIARTCLTRSKLEDTFRFVKQSYNLEDIRVMKYQRLKNLVVLATAAAYFAAAVLGRQMEPRILCEKLLIISQRFFGIPPFRFYALAGGIRKILSQTTLRPPEAPPASL